MRQFTAFIQKEWMEQIRSKKGLIIILISILFGIMNPAIAKLTPWMMEQLSESLAASGMVLTKIEITALTSWEQFYKNIPIALIIFLLMFSGSLSGEYQRGTLINILTKGMNRSTIILSKTFILIFGWSVCYWLCFGITYGYNAYFWDNGIASNLFFSAFCIYLIGVWLITMLILISTAVKSGSAVLVSLTGIYVGCYLLGLIPKVKAYLPTQLMSSPGLLTEAAVPGDYLKAVIIILILSVGGIILSIQIFNRKQL